MNKDILKKAVELADGFDATYEGIDLLDEQGLLETGFDWEDVPQYALDALAAQLVRQVDSMSETGMTDIMIKRLGRAYDGEWPIDRTAETIEDAVEWLEGDSDS